MPKRSPFTSVPGRLAQLARPRRADLHVHTTASDGEYTASQVVALARQANLAAVAITDHDTLDSVSEARSCAPHDLEVVPGVEISAEFLGREVHLLGYFLDIEHPGLNGALARIRERRRERFHDYIAKLAENGTRLPNDRVKFVADSAPSLGRRHVAGLLLACRLAATRNEAFGRFLGPIAKQVIPKVLVPVEEAIRLVRSAGGVASLAHPPDYLRDVEFHRLREMGLSALEVVYPWGRNSPATRLRETATRLGLAVTGGSDCHGPEPSHRRIGSHAITSEELSRLREMCDQPDCCASRN